MASRLKSDEPPERRRPPARDPEERERQLTSQAYDYAERALATGEASSQIVTHFLQVGSSKQKLELERLRGENRLLSAKVEQLQTIANQSELLERAIEALTSYKTTDDSGFADD